MDHRGDHVKVALSGCVSGAVGVMVPYPFNMVRCLQQTQKQMPRSVLAAIREVAGTQAGVFRGLYRGIGSALMLYTPATSVFYLTYFRSNEAYLHLTGNEHTSSFLAGMTANVSASVLWTPMDNIVQRVWIHRQTATTVVRDLYKTSGLGGFWRAYTATLGVWTPLCGAFFMTYNALVTQVRPCLLYTSPSPRDRG